MKGYKGTEADMTCRGFQYELGKTYTAESVVLCQHGFHFCQNLKDVFDFYGNDCEHRFFEIEAAGDILSDGQKSVCSEIYFTRELTPIEINRAYYGDGYGDGYGYGYGDGYGYGLKAVNGQALYRVDGLPMVFDHIHGEVARGRLLMQDFTMVPCYVCKQDGIFAHGETLHEARAALEAKLFEAMPLEARIEAFCREFKPCEERPNREWFDWHHRLTGSCEMGRRAFVANRGLDLDGACTPKAFFDLTREAFAPAVMAKAEAAWKKYWSLD